MKNLNTKGSDEKEKKGKFPVLEHTYLPPSTNELEVYSNNGNNVNRHTHTHTHECGDAGHNPHLDWGEALSDSPCENTQLRAFLVYLKLALTKTRIYNLQGT
ncbi:hypothetical protein WA026_009433 [Henosepilachna vigintioctopunctata]|uniref:Uncharacterized protein n=1 Tax=Henosepilachna vigintioctopunctata TaxID=420089 RepID=A0AAW1TZC7_9CUCU